jgi:hypothetical protein
VRAALAVTLVVARGARRAVARRVCWAARAANDIGVVVVVVVVGVGERRRTRTWSSKQRVRLFLRRGTRVGDSVGRNSSDRVTRAPIHSFSPSSVIAPRITFAASLLPPVRSYACSISKYDERILKVETTVQDMEARLVDDDLRREATQLKISWNALIPVVRLPNELLARNGAQGVHGRRPRLYLPPTPHTIHQRSPALDALYAEWNERVVTKLLVHAESHLVHTVVSTDRANLDELCRGLQRVGSLEIMISDEESMERVNHLEPTE